MTVNQRRKRILSGVQPSGKLHVGNYFGAVKQHIALQDEAECFYFIADYHALTTIHDPKILSDNTRDVALDYLALGLDPERATFFRQSDVPEVTELTWILGTVTSMGLLERSVSYKDKVAKGIEASVGLFVYPVLMAADILIYRSHKVPVGEDQKQQVEMTSGMGDGEAKKLLLEKINSQFEPARQKRKQLAANPDHVEEVLKRGAARARAEAQKTMELVRRAVGMLPRPVA